MPVNINRNILLKEFKKFNLDIIENEAAKIAENKMSQIREELINDFKNHPVAKEIEGGIEAENISSTLNGIGNLSTYIGFSPTDNPIEPVKNILKTVRINNKGKKIHNQDEISFEFEVISPTIEEIESVGKLPFEQGQSWIKGIENGISGFGAYIYGKIFKNSRSTKGLQSKNIFRTGTFKTVSYLSEIMEKFYLKLKK